MHIHCQIGLYKQQKTRQLSGKYQLPSWIFFWKFQQAPSCRFGTNFNFWNLVRNGKNSNFLPFFGDACKQLAEISQIGSASFGQESGLNSISTKKLLAASLQVTDGDR